MLRDSHSYETQIIDAVRSVNRALGGTYGTSSAIYKSEFNQYEVQLIDAIKGIGRTLSGKGLSVAGGDGSGASSAELQRLSQRVSKLESESFFRLVDGNVTLKEQYQNLWVPGWLSAGGIGQGGGGGGGSSYLKELLDVYHNDGGILRGNGDPVEEGDVLVYDATDPDNPMWIAAEVTASGVVTNYGDSTTGRIAKIGTEDIYNGVKWGAAGQTEHTFTLTINGVTKTVALDGYGGGGGGTVTGYIGTTQVQSSAAAQALTGISSVKLSSASSLFEWDDTNSAWHFHGNLYSDGWVSAGGIGSPGGGTADVDLAAVWDSLTNAVADVYASTKINVAHIPDITTAMISNLETWITGKNYLAQGAAYTLRTPVTRTAANGVLLGVDALSNAASSAAGSDASRIEWNADLYAWHVYGNLYADGWVSAGGVGSGGSGSVEHLGDIGDVTLTSLEDGQSLVWDAENSIWKNSAAQGGSLANLSDVSLSSPSSGQALVYRNGGWVNGKLYLTNLGDVDVTTTYEYDEYVLTYQNDGMKFVLAPSGGGGGGSTVSWGTTYSDHTVDLTVNGVTKNICLDGYSSGGSGGSLSDLSDVSLSGLTNGQALVYRNGTWRNEAVSGGGSGSTVNWGTGNDYYVPLTVDNVTKNVLIGTGYVTLDTAQSISGAKTFTNSNGIGIGASAHTLKYNDSLSRFEFNGNLYVSGNIVASGSVTAGA